MQGIELDSLLAQILVSRSLATQMTGVTGKGAIESTDPVKSVGQF